MSKLYVGAARRTIDPTPDMYPMPTRFNIADAYYDSCFCRVIAVGNGEEKLLFVVLELSDYPTVENLIPQLSEATGVKKENILITFTHNHTSPCDESNNHPGRPPETEEQLARREKFKTIELEAALSAAKEAVETMRPARMGYGTVDSFVNVNRDYQSSYGYWIEAPNYAGFSDKTLACLKFEDEEGKLIAALLNHGTHSTCAFLQKDADHKTKTSGNFSGVATKFAEKHFGGDAVIAWTAGAAGNQNPIMSHGLLYEYPDGYVSEVSYPDGVGFMQMEYVGRRHGADAVRCIDSIVCDVDDLSLSHVSTLALLPAQKRVPGVQGVIRMGGHGLRDEAEIPYGKVPPLPDFSKVTVPDPEHPVKMYIHLVKLGDVALIMTNGEMYAELGAAIKKASPMEKTVVVTYSTEKSTSYILDRSSKHHRVFQSFSATIPGSADDIILDAVQKLFREN